MIQILTCTNIDLTCTNSCTKQKFSEASVGLYTEQKFGPEIKEIFVVPCPGTRYSRAGSEMFKLTRPANAWCSKKTVAIIARPNVSI